MVFAGYSGFLHYLQLASHELATIGINVTKNEIQIQIQIQIIEVYLCATVFCFHCSEVISEVCPLLSKGFPCLHAQDISLKSSMLWPVKIFSSKILKNYFLLGIVNDIPKLTVNL